MSFSGSENSSNQLQYHRELFYVCATGVSELKPPPKYPKYKEEEKLEFSNEELLLDEDELEQKKREVFLFPRFIFQKEYEHDRVIQGIRDSYIVEILEMLFSKGIDLNVTDVQGT